MARFTPRKRTVFGGVLAAGIIAGIYLGGKLPQMGSGFGLGKGGDGLIGQPADDGDPPQVEVAGKQTPDATDSDDHKEAEGGPTPRRTDAAPMDDVLTILVEDRHYAVWRKTRRGNGYFPAELSDIVKLAQVQEANADGIRVRILRSESARVTAWKAIQSELVKSGIPADEIILPRELVSD